MTEGIFLSYSSDDAAAARRICEALRAAGLEVWFDQSELRGGDAWDASIGKQNRECALFVPMISAGTDARSEGDVTFLFPRRCRWRLAASTKSAVQGDWKFGPAGVNCVAGGMNRVFGRAPA